MLWVVTPGSRKKRHITVDLPSDSSLLDRLSSIEAGMSHLAANVRVVQHKQVSSAFPLHRSLHQGFWVLSTNAERLFGRLRLRRESTAFWRFCNRKLRLRCNNSNSNNRADARCHSRLTLVNESRCCCDEDWESVARTGNQ